MSIKWDQRFLKLAKHISGWSRDPSTQTGCVIVDSYNRVLSVGYNGFPGGVDDTPDRYQDREVKYRFVAHCDLNAIYSAARIGVSLVGSTMYLTGAPCHECAKGIIQVGIKRVVWPVENTFEQTERWKLSMETMKTMMKEAGVELCRV